MDIQEVLQRHRKWWTGEDGGECANLSGADLSGAKGLLDSIDYLKAHFEFTPAGMIAFKTVGAHYPPNLNWSIKPGSVLSEVVNPDRGTDCGSGVNMATLSWVKRNSPDRDIWKCLVRWEWLVGVVVPFGTDGKVRASRVELVEIVSE